MTALNKQALRLTAEKAKDNFMPNFMVPTRDVLSLLDELEAAEKYAKDRDAENEDLMLTVGRLRVEKEAAEKRIAELEARDVELPKLKMLSDYLAEVTQREREDILVGVKLEFHRMLTAAGISVKGE
ncbi:ead/Ea22-like family protein [Citrobacter freundii]